MSYNYNSFRSFSVIDWHAFQDKMIQAIDNEIENNTDDYILNVNEGEYRYRKYISGNFFLIVLFLFGLF